MQWFYALNGQRVGPVSSEQFAQLVAAGTIHGDTLVWREGLANWVKWGEIAAQTPLPDVSVGTVAMPMAQDAGYAEESTSAETAADWSADEFTRRLRENGFAYSLEGGFGRIWKNMTNGYGMALGVAIVAAIIVGVSSLIPLVSLAAAFVVTPQITAGLVWFFLRRTRGEEPPFDALFDGFRLRFGSLAAVAGIQTLAGIVFAVAMLLLMIPFGISFQDMEAAEDLAPAAAIGFVTVMMVFGFVVTVLAARFMLVHVILMDSTMGVFDAFRLSWRITGMRFWTLLVLAIIIFLITLVATLLLILPVILVLPLAPAALAQVYEDARLSAAGTPAE